MSIPSIIGFISSFEPLYRYVALFVLVMAEGPLVTMLAGLLAALGTFNPYMAYVVILCADIVSDAGYYGVGRWGGGVLYKKASPERMEKFQMRIHAHQGKILIFGKWTHVMGVPLLLAVGASRLSFWRFIMFDTIATIPKSLILLIVGFYMGHAADMVNTYLTDGTLIMTGILLIFFIGYVFLGKYLKEKFFPHLVE